MERLDDGSGFVAFRSKRSEETEERRLTFGPKLLSSACRF
jgi:hypothetical protein